MEYSGVTRVLLMNMSATEPIAAALANRCSRVGRAAMAILKTSRLRRLTCGTLPTRQGALDRSDQSSQVWYMQRTDEIPGYDYGTERVARSPVSREDLRELERAASGDGKRVGQDGHAADRALEPGVRAGGSLVTPVTVRSRKTGT